LSVSRLERRQVILAAGEVRFAELGQDRLQHLRLGDAGVEDQGRVVVVGIEFAQELAAQGGLAAADLADEHDEALFLVHTVFKMLQGLLVGGAEVEELRVRSDVKRHLRKTVVALIHRVGNYLGRTGKCTPKERELALKNVARAWVFATDVGQNEQKRTRVLWPRITRTEAEVRLIFSP
jgi:hypothetical protein